VIKIYKGNIKVLYFLNLKYEYLFYAFKIVLKIKKRFGVTLYAQIALKRYMNNSNSIF